MSIDPKDLSPDEVRFSGSGWSVFVKMKGVGWRLYQPAGRLVSIEFKTAREMYEEAVRDPSCDSAVLVRLETAAGFNRGPLEGAGEIKV
jgi:hypothetical protein